MTHPVKGGNITVKKMGGWFYTNVKGGLSRKEKTFQRVDQSVLQTWLRKKHNIILEVVAFYEGSDLPLSDKKFPKPKGYFYWDSYDDDFKEDVTVKFKTYEKALERALQEGLKLIK